jgi:ADP-heptose:LPS heptosyltransferase
LDRTREFVRQDRPLVLLSPGASDPRRRWPIERFAEVARSLVQSDARVAVVGSAEDGPLAGAVLERVPEVSNLAGGLEP